MRGRFHDPPQHRTKPSCGYTIGSAEKWVSILQSALEDLILVPGNVDYVHSRLVRPGDEQGFSGESVYSHARLVSGYVEGGYADPAVFGDA
jgi:hypothetical protein